MVMSDKSSYRWIFPKVHDHVNDQGERVNVNQGDVIDLTPEQANTLRGRVKLLSVEAAELEKAKVEAEPEPEVVANEEAIETESEAEAVLKPGKHDKRR
jgi:hypothetical protein